MMSMGLGIVRKTETTKPTGFTLPELMVVVSILLLLSSLLFPVFATARAKAKATVCSAQLAQIHRSALIYMSDWNDTFPSAKDCLEVYAPIGYSQAGLEWLAAAPFLFEALKPYSQASELFRCPSDSGAAIAEFSFPTAVPLTSSAFGSCGMSYVYHVGLAYPALSGTSIANPSGVNMIEDMAGHWHGTGQMMLPSDSWDAFYRKRSNYRYNVVYVDGHVKNVDWWKKEDAWKQN